MQREYAWPAPLWDRETPAAWADAGAEDAWRRANRAARERLAEHRPGYLDLSIERQLRARYRLHD